MTEFDQVFDTTGSSTSNKLDEAIKSPPDFTSVTQFSLDPVKQQEELLERCALKSKIIRYLKKFSNELEGYTYKLQDLDKLSNGDLGILLKELQIAVAQSGSNDIPKSLYFGAVQFTEKFACISGYDIEGFHQAMYTNQTVHKCLDEICLEMEDQMYMPAHLRLGYITVRAMIDIYTIKDQLKKRDNKLVKPVSQDTLKEYDDL